MIPMSCPSCGRRGNVPLDRLNTRMHCKKCDAVFHLDATGKPVMGEPAPPKGSKAAKGARDKNEPLDPIGFVAEKLSHTPKPIWMTAAVVAAGWLLWTGSGWIGSGPVTAEQSLTQEISKATTAFLEKDMATLNAMTASGTEETMARAVETFRPMIGDGTATSEGIVFSPSEPVGDEEHKEVDVTLIALSGNSFNLKFALVKFKKKWFIDGATTYQLIEAEVASKKAAAQEK